MDYSVDISGRILEYYDDTHTYLVDGMIVPSITKILQVKFGGKYSGVSREVLGRAAYMGTMVHDAIQDYCEHGTESDLPEVRNFKFLKRQYGFKVLKNEVPVILSIDDIPVAAGRLDMVMEMDGKIGGADIKRTSVLDKMYLAYQLNLYRIAYRQCYGTDWEFLRGLHLRGNKRKFVEIPISEESAWEIVGEYRKIKEEDDE